MSSEPQTVLGTQFRTFGGSSRNPDTLIVMSRLLSRDTQTIAAAAYSAPTFSIDALRTIQAQNAGAESMIIASILDRHWHADGAARGNVASILVSKGQAQGVLDILRHLEPQDRMSVLKGGDTAIVLAKSGIPLEVVASLYPENPGMLLHSMEALLKPMTQQGEVKSPELTHLRAAVQRFDVALGHGYKLENYPLVTFEAFYDARFPDSSGQVRTIRLALQPAAPA